MEFKTRTQENIFEEMISLFEKNFNQPLAKDSFIVDVFKKIASRHAEELQTVTKYVCEENLPKEQYYIGWDGFYQNPDNTALESINNGIDILKINGDIYSYTGIFPEDLIGMSSISGIRVNIEGTDSPTAVANKVKSSIERYRTYTDSYTYKVTSIKSDMMDATRYMFWNLEKDAEDPGPPPTMLGLSQQIAAAQTFTFGGLQYAPTSNPITYPYPDGSTSTTKPIDNQVFIIWDHQGQQIKSTWQWNEGKQVWHLASSVDDFPMESKMDKPKLRCECGSEAVGSNRHSNWCPFHL